MPRKHKPKRKAPQPSRLEKAQAWFSYLAREYRALGIRMVTARLELLAADAEERAQMHFNHPDDEVIKRAAIQAAQDLHDWNVKMGRVQEVEETDPLPVIETSNPQGVFLDGQVVNVQGVEGELTKAVIKVVHNDETTANGT